MKKTADEPGNRIAIQNVMRVLKALFRRYASAKWQVPVYMICKLSGPFLATLIPTIAIAYIIKGRMVSFLFAMAGVLLLTAGVRACTSVLDARISFKCNFTRRGYFCYQYVDKNLSTDYVNVEPQGRQKEIQKGAYAINSGWIGMEQLMKRSIEILICIFGLVFYGATVIFLDIRILLIMIVMFALDFIFRSHAIKFQDSLIEENVRIHRTKSYLERSGLELKAGKDIRVYQMERWFRAVYMKVIRAAARYAVRTEIRWYLPSLTGHICLSARDLLAYFILVGMTVSGRITPATFTLYLGLIAGFSEWMYSIAHSLNVIRRASHEFNYYLSVMNTKDEFLHEGGEKMPHPNQPFKIEFEDVSFRYTGAEKDTLSHLSFVIQPGEKIALVGNNGAGKTTIVKLLCGLYQPTGGRILVNDKELGKMNIIEYQKRVSVLFQDVNPLSFSIETNIAGCKADEIDHDKVITSLKRSGLWEKVETLEKKEKTYVTQELDNSGIQLSGGETQKLLLARAIYKDGPLLILDEPTSALDPIAESRMYEEYNRMTEEKTSVFISHRLASTKFCDRIFFLDNGSIIEEGSHEQLIRRNGQYKGIFDIQSHYYQEKVVEAYGA